MGQLMANSIALVGSLCQLAAVFSNSVCGELHRMCGCRRQPGLARWAGEKEMPYFREVLGRELVFRLS